MPAAGTERWLLTLVVLAFVAAVSVVGARSTPRRLGRVERSVAAMAVPAAAVVGLVIVVLDGTMRHGPLDAPSGRFGYLSFLVAALTAISLPVRTANRRRRDAVA